MSELILEHLKPFTEIIWDWNGTLLNDRDICLSVEAELFPLYGVNPPSREERNRLFCMPVEIYYERVGFDLKKHSSLRIFFLVYEEDAHI